MAYIEGHILETENTEQRHMVADVGEAGNVDRVCRILDLGVAHCEELLYPYTKRGVYRPLENETREREAYCLVLSLPETFSQTTLNLLEHLIHEYLVSRAIADWMSITNPAKAETWAVKAQECEAGICGCLNARMSRTRRKCHPF